MDAPELHDIPQDIEPVVESSQKLKKKRKQVCDKSTSCSISLPIRFMLVACPWADEYEESAETEEEEVPKKKRVVKESSTRSINLWRKVTEQVTGSKKIVTKKSEEYAECLRIYHEQKELAAKAEQEALLVPKLEQVEVIE